LKKSIYRFYNNPDSVFFGCLNLLQQLIFGLQQTGKTKNFAQKKLI